MPEVDSLSFDVLLKGETDDVNVASGNLDKLRPSPEAIEHCYRWLSKKGVVCHRTDFGLACEATISLFESLFQTKVVKQQKNGVNIYQLQHNPQPPVEIQELVSQVTIARPPTLFT